MLRTTCNALLTMIVLAVLALFVVARAYPALNGYSTVHIAGRSMEPTIPLSALAYVAPAERFRVGDVVTFAMGDNIITHRIVGDWSGIGRGPWQTKGDANAAPDAELVPSNRIIGAAVAYVPLAGLLVTIVTQAPVMAFVLILAALLLYLPR